MGAGHRGMMGDVDLCGVGHTGGTSIRAAAAQVLPARRPEDGGVTASPPSHRGGRSAGPEGKRRLRGALGEDSPHSFSNSCTSVLDLGEKQS